MRTPLSFLIREWIGAIPWKGLLAFFFFCLALGDLQAQTYGEEEPNNSLAEALGGFTPDPLQQRIFQEVYLVQM